MNILITGAAGYIGSHIVKQLSAQENITVTLVDNLCGGTFDSISILKKLYASENFDFLKCDLNEYSRLEELFRVKKFDAIIHLAAHLQVGESVLNPLKYYLNNTLNTTYLLKLCQKYNVNKFVFSSTAAVYGEPKDMPITELTPTKPINPYGMSKLMSEQILKDIANSNKNFSYVILRYFNVAGASLDNSLGESHIPETHLIPLIAHTALGKREKITIFGDDYETHDGSCIRDYVHVEDLAAAHIKSLKYLFKNNDSDVFNCGYGHGYSVKEVIRAMKKVSQADFNVEIAPRRGGDPAVLIADNTKIIEKMKWSPRFDNLEIICKSALEWERKL